MQQQKGAADCGIFVAAVCTSIVFRKNPSNTVWNQPKFAIILLIVFETNVYPYSLRFSLTRVQWVGLEYEKESW